MLSILVARSQSAVQRRQLGRTSLTEYKEYAGDDPGLEGVESICFRRVCGDSIEDVDEDKKKSN